MYSVLVLKVVSALMLMGLVMSVKRTNEGTNKTKKCSSYYRS